jgi:hypothetical protein
MIERKISISKILGDRYDIKYLVFKELSSEVNSPLCSLGNLLISPPQYGANEAGIERKDITSPRYIRITDINEQGLLSDELGATAMNIQSKYILNNNDILIARSGNTVGKSFIYKEKEYNYKCFFAGYMLRFVVDPTKIIPDFLFIITQLDYFKRWVNAVQRAAGQPNINATEYCSFPVPMPNLSYQKDIVLEYTKAQLVQKKEQQTANKLLNKISFYIKEELGLTQSSKIKSKVEFVKLSYLIGKKWGVLRDKDTTSTKFDTISLMSIAVLEKGKTITKKNILEGEIPVIAGGQTSPYNHNVANYDGNVITISASGAYAGYVWYHRTPIFASDCTVIYSKDESVFKTEYIYEVLKAQQKYLYSLQRGAAQPHVYAKDLNNILIPKVPIEKQEEIIQHVTNIRTRADQLLDEGNRIFEKVKQDIEKFIIK